ncbi:MAG: diguanylate cyclase (GGDEF)-like protein/PAS domain S-box-containing protein [Gammaproteobacteria bacterium]|jgi:diguanylate cyclase (GGDEF)-like protein/PAS domain S-box-containing protein
MLENIVIALIAGIASAAIIWFWVARKLSAANLIPSSDKLRALIAATAGTAAEPFIYALVREMARYLSFDSIIIAEFKSGSQKQYRCLRSWSGGDYQQGFTFKLSANFGFEDSQFRHSERSGFELFNDAEVPQGFGPVMGSFVIKVESSSGHPAGVLIGLSSRAFVPSSEEIEIIKLLSARVASELEQMAARKITRENKNRALMTLMSIGDAVMTTDEKGVINFMNPVAERLSGWKASQALGLSVETVLHFEHEHSGEVIPDPAIRCLAERRVISPRADNVLISKNGEQFSIQGTAAPIFDQYEEINGVVLVFKDVTDSREFEKIMFHQATHDPLTGLVNRAEFERRLENTVSSAHEYDSHHALLFLDLDQFKPVNDSAGHLAGDELLIQLSSLLSTQLRTRDTLGRMGGDEFCALLSNCPISKAQKVAEILIETVSDYRFFWESKTYQISVSIGIVVIDAKSLNTSTVLKHADHACYAAKDLGRSRAYTYRGELEGPDKLQPRDKLSKGELESVLEDERFELMYQPIIPLDPEQAGNQTHAEVLLRLRNESKQLLLPGSFLPSASRFGLSTRIDRWVLTQVINDYSNLFLKNPGLTLSVNLTSASVLDDGFSNFVESQFNQSNVEPGQVCFELSEMTLINNLGLAGQLIEQLVDFGCHFAIDDFGSGLTSFNYLKDLAIEFIKIDGSLVKDMCDDDIDYEMIVAINSMSHLLGMKTIAECADSEAIVDRLTLIGVDYAQGYYLGNPDPMNNLAGIEHQVKSEGLRKVN